MSSAAASSPSHGVPLQKNLTKIYWIGFFTFLHFISPVLIPFFTEWGGISFTQTMILQSIFTGGIFLFEVPAGVVSDAFSRKKTLMVSYVVNAFATFIYGSYPHYGIFILGELTWAFAAALNSGTQSAFLYDTLKALGRETESKAAFAKLGTLSLIGVIVAAPLGSAIAKWISLQMCMVLMGVPFLIAFGIATSLQEPPRNAAETSTQKPNPIKTFKESFDLLRKSEPLHRLILNHLGITVLGYFMVWLYQPRLLSLGMDMVYFGWVNVGYVVAEILLMNAYQPLEKVLHSKRAVVYGTGAFLGVGYCIAVIWNTP